jgi:hypothetical protein
MCENNADKIKVLIDKAVEDKLNTILPENTIIHKEKIEIKTMTRFCQTKWITQQKLVRN